MIWNIDVYITKREKSLRKENGSYHAIDWTIIEDMRKGTLSSVVL